VVGIQRVCGDKISCPPRQLNGGCIETALDSNLIGLHLPCTATAEREARGTIVNDMTIVMMMITFDVCHTEQEVREF